MDFNSTIQLIASILNSTGTTINTDDYDGIIVKKLEASNTLDENRTTNQTHIAITGNQMDIFPYLRSDGYFNEKESDSELKKYFITQVPITLYESNIRYLNSENNVGINFSDGKKRSCTSVVRSRRKNQADQIQVSLINFDGKDFVEFRKMLHAGYYLIVLKHKNQFDYDVFGVIPNRKINGDGNLSSVNNQFYKLATNTAINIERLQSNENDTISITNKEKTRKDSGCNVLLYGVPGSGKSWTIEHEYCKPESKVERLVFHPDYTYSDFIGQILPNVAEDGQVSYKFTPGPFTNILRDAYLNPKDEYILIIEEINRGNAPAIFGEVFQLLDRKVEMEENEDGYPVGSSEYGITNPNIAKIVYGDLTHKVRIPSNLSIIGTMNTSDQNVFTLDTAFQRRWDMRLIENDFSNVDPKLADAEILDTTVSWRDFCTAVNEIVVGNSARMTSSEDKRLGAYFVHLRDLKFNPDMGDLKEGRYDQLRKKESEESLTSSETVELTTIRDALKQNRKFPEKVIKYLWDDAFKFNREVIFEITEYQSLEQVIRAFMYSKGIERFNVFKENVRAAFTNSSN